VSHKPDERKFSNGLIEYVIKTGHSLLLNSHQISELINKGIIAIYEKLPKTWLGVPLKMKGKNIGVLICKEYFEDHLLGETEKEMLELVAFPISRTIERKLIEQERINYTQELKELNETKDKFFSIISHDLRSPFDSILGFSEVLKIDFDDLSESEIKLFIDSLYQTSRHVYNILNNLLHYSRFQLGKIDFEPKQISLKRIIDKIIEMLQGIVLKKNIHIQNNLVKDIFVFADEDMLNSVILNLTTNAIKFTNSGGKVVFSAVENEEYAKITVEDTGIGMNRETLNNLFKPSLNKSTLGTANETGTGLGLLLIKDFIIKNGGNITVESIPGKGSTFTFTLPLAKINSDTFI
jgi:signal transduction histidine kinase